MDTKRLYELSERADEILSGETGDIQEVIKKIKPIISEFKSGSVGIAQLNPVVGDIEHNAKKIMKYISYATAIDLDLVVFPEMALVGYPLGDTIGRHSVIAEENIKWLKEIANLTTTTTAIVGFVEPIKEKSEVQKYYSSIAVLSEGKIEGIIRKSVLPSRCEFNDYRYIEPSHVIGTQPAKTICSFDKSEIVTCEKTNVINSLRYGISVCEDFLDNDKNPISELSKENPDVFINCSASPTRAKKEQLKHNILSFISKSYETPVIYVNQVGAIDNISFDGSSRVFNGQGELIARARSFEEQFLIVNPTKNIGKIYPTPKGLDTTIKEDEKFSLDYEDDLERTYRTILQGIRDYFRKNGIKRACLGLSGGLDSTVCATLLTDAIGKENVFGVSMPSKITSNESRSDAELLAINLGIGFAEVPIKPMVETANLVFNDMFAKVETKWNCRYKKSFTQDNIQARTRAVYLWGIANEFESCIPIATSDKSEAYMGYATINGDMSGGFAPIADVSKTKLFALAKWLNANRAKKNAIPESVIQKRPGAELAIDERTGKPLIAEDALMPYEFLDEVIWRIENRHEEYRDMINSEFLYEKKNNISKEQKTQWLDKFYKRMSTALYKGSIMPPSVTLESRLGCEYDYKQPITSSRINYKGSDIEIIKTELKRAMV